MIKDITGSNSTIRYLPATEDDPKQRRPDITTARQKINWHPRHSVKDGLMQAIAYFRQELIDNGTIEPTGPSAAKPQQKVKQF